MRQRTRTCGALLSLLLLGIVAPGASAGTYEVVSCGAPGAGGVNLAWTPEFTSFTNPNNGQYFAPEPERYDLVDYCGASKPGLEARPKETLGDNGFLRGAQWRFDAPAGTRLTRLTVWRFGVKLRTAQNDPDANVEGDQGDPWEIAGIEANANPIGGRLGETCDAPQGSGGCSFGSDSGVTDAARVTYPLNTSFIAYRVICGNLSGCPRAVDDPNTAEPPAAIARMKVFAASVTVTDDTAPAVKAGGPLFADGLRTAADPVSVEASDSTGIRAVRLEVDGSIVKRETLACDLRRRAPCPGSDTRDLSLAGFPLSDGEHSVAVVAEDASGNEARAEKRIRVDANGPRIAIDRLSGKRIAATVTDAGSGVAAGSIEVRDPGAGAFRPLTSRLDGSRLSATLDKGTASRVGLRISARDNAGNRTVVEGNPTRLTATRAVIGRRTRTIRGGRVKSSATVAVSIKGTLRGSDGAPLGGRRIEVTSVLRRSGAGRAPSATVSTGPDGRFTAVLAPGPSRQVRLAFNGEGGGLPSARGVSLRVPASTSLRASTTSLRGRGRVSFSGRLALAGQRVPRSGKLIELQGRVGRGYQTIATTRARGSSARWRTSYRFRTGRPGRYRFRARVRRESSFPFELGYSRVVTVRIR